MKNSALIHIHISHSLKERLRALSLEEGTTMSALIRTTLEQRLRTLSPEPAPQEDRGIRLSHPNKVKPSELNFPSADPPSTERISLVWDSTKAKRGHG